MNEVVKRRAAGALVLIGLAFIAVSLLPGVGETPGEDGVKVVVIDLDAPESVKPDALPLETPPPGVARADEPLPAEVAEAQGTDSLPDPGEAPAGTEPEAEPEPEPESTSAPSPDESTTRPSLKLAETISTTKPKPAEAPPKTAATTTEKPATKPATPPTATAAAPKPVKPVEAPTPAPVPATKPVTTPPPAATAAAKPGNAWFVQVGGFADIQNARQAQDRLKAVGQASIIAPMESAQGTLYRVRAGPYKTREAAAAAQQKIASGGFTGSALVNP